MESAQRELMSVLLGRVLSLGLISKSTYSKAEDLLYSGVDLPEFFIYPECVMKEEVADECPQNTK